MNSFPEFFPIKPSPSSACSFAQKMMQTAIFFAIRTGFAHYFRRPASVELSLTI
jgi:hypothetical protein